MLTPGHLGQDRAGATLPCTASSQLPAPQGFRLPRAVPQLHAWGCWPWGGEGLASKSHPSIHPPASALRCWDDRYTLVFFLLQVREAGLVEGQSLSLEWPRPGSAHSSSFHTSVQVASDIRRHEPHPILRLRLQGHGKRGSLGSPHGAGSLCSWPGPSPGAAVGVESARLGCRQAPRWPERAEPWQAGWLPVSTCSHESRSCQAASHLPALRLPPAAPCLGLNCAGRSPWKWVLGPQ